MPVQKMVFADHKNPEDRQALIEYLKVQRRSGVPEPRLVFGDARKGG